MNDNDKMRLAKDSVALLRSWLKHGQSPTLLDLMDSCRQWQQSHEIACLSFFLENNPGIGYRSKLAIQLMVIRHRVNYGIDL